MPFTDLSDNKKRPAFVRPNKMFTADKNLILSVAGHLSEAKIQDAINAIISIISSK